MQRTHKERKSFEDSDLISKSSHPSRGEVFYDDSYCSCESYQKIQGELAINISSIILLLLLLL